MTGRYVGAAPHSPAVCAGRLLHCCSSRCAARAHASVASAAAGCESLQAAPAACCDAHAQRAAELPARNQVGAAAAAATAHTANEAAVLAIAAAAVASGAVKAATQRQRFTC